MSNSWNFSSWNLPTFQADSASHFKHLPNIPGRKKKGKKKGKRKENGRKMEGKRKEEKKGRKKEKESKKKGK